jgi:hypothetical protein
MRRDLKKLDPQRQGATQPSWGRTKSPEIGARGRRAFAVASRAHRSRKRRRRSFSPRFRLRSAPRQAFWRGRRLSISVSPIPPCDVRDAWRSRARRSRGGSGMAAVSAAAFRLSAGVIVAARRCSVRAHGDRGHPALRRHATLVDGGDLGQWRAAMTPATKMLGTRPIDSRHRRYKAVRDRLRARCAAGCRQRFRHARCGSRLSSARISWYSTKYIDGQGRCLGGVVLCREDFLKIICRPSAQHRPG